MRIMDTGRPGLVRLAFGGDGRRLLATAPDGDLSVWDWVAGESVLSIPRCSLDAQPAISADSQWVACFAPDFRVLRTDGQPPIVRPSHTLPGSGDLVGGLAFSPDGKSLVATQQMEPFKRFVSGRLVRWTTSGWHPMPGFAPWPPFDRLAYDRSGQLLAGINPARFELRFAVSGGLNGWARPGANVHSRQMHLSFAPGGRLVAFGWHSELHIMDTGPGKVVKVISDSRAPFRDAAFTMDGSRLATVSDDGTVAFHDMQTGHVTERFDWSAGPLRCLAFSPDGACGICGTADGKMIVFDLE